MSRKLVWNERVKAIATLMNNFATAAIVTAVLGPLVAASSAQPRIATSFAYLLTLPLGLILALTFSGVAYAVLGRLEE